MLSTLITSKSRIEIITWFISHPGERFHYLQLDKLLKTSRASLQKELKRLEAGGLLRSRKEGNIRFYWVNQDYPLYPELKSIIFKTVGLADFLRDSLFAIGTALFTVSSLAAALASGQSKTTRLGSGRLRLKTSRRSAAPGATRRRHPRARLHRAVAPAA